MESEASAIQSLLEESSDGITRLFLEDVVRELDVGIHKHEMGSLQRVRFDIHIWLNGANLPISDSIDSVLDYEYLDAAIDRVTSGGRTGLLETMASNLLDDVMSPPEVIAASVRLTKLNVKGFDGKFGCSMSKTKN
jgi:dihydroneopterin aldolase